MSAPDINHHVMKDFVDLSEKHLTILLGAGASAPSGLPTWDQFTNKLAVLSGLVASEDDANILLETQDPTIMLAAAKAESANEWPKFLNEALYGHLLDEGMPSPLHLAAAGHYMALPVMTTLGTLNFDTLLEAAVLNEGAQRVAIDLNGYDEDAETPTVHHLHGAIFDGQAHSPVVDYHDFAELIAQKDAWQYRFLKDALDRGPLLLTGTTYRDPDLRHWLHLIFRDEKPSHPAFVTIVREGLELDRDTFGNLDTALASEWESIGLTALRMQDFSDLAIVIRELQFAGLADYRAPYERSLRVWEAHKRGFNDLQHEYGRLLKRDAQRVAEAVGTNVHRGTLWLANGHGQLARWASEGSHYRDVDYLKHIPTGHDSPWIAGEAIGSEEVKLKDVERDHRVIPTWRSVLAIPLFVGDSNFPGVATAVLTFGLGESASTLLSHEEDWLKVTQEVSETWSVLLGKNTSLYSPR